MEIKLDDRQQEAVLLATSSRLSIITGGAGTGKTTIIKAIADSVDSPRLCAFAGKAASRLREATGHPAETIHRMLGYNGERYTTSLLRGFNVIIDEASMVDSSIMAEVLRRSPKSVTLVGDAAQLPPVGQGQPFHDLLSHGLKNTITLETCYRATEAIFQAANTIRSGQMPPAIAKSPGETWEIKHSQSAESAHWDILSLIDDGWIDFDNDIILIPRNGDGEDPAPCTVKKLNEDIREIVNPGHGDMPVDVGDRVINTKNLPDLDAWNGTTGRVHSVDLDGTVTVKVDVPVRGSSGELEDMVMFRKGVAKHLSLAYAMTVHKAQGSQYRRVVFAALQRDTWALLDRSLFYTAITRAKESCLVIGQMAAVNQAVNTARSKSTVLQLLLAGGTGDTNKEER